MSKIIKLGDVVKATASPKEKIRQLEGKFLAVADMLVKSSKVMAEQEEQINELFERVAKLEKDQKCKGHL